MAEFIPRLDIEYVVYGNIPTPAPGVFTVAVRTEVASEGGPGRLHGVGQRPVVMRVEEGERQDALGRQHSAQ